MRTSTQIMVGLAVVGGALYLASKVKAGNGGNGGNGGTECEAGNQGFWDCLNKYGGGWKCVNGTCVNMNECTAGSCPSGEVCEWEPTEQIYKCQPEPTGLATLKVKIYSPESNPIKYHFINVWQGANFMEAFGSEATFTVATNTPIYISIYADYVNYCHMPDYKSYCPDPYRITESSLEITQPIVITTPNTIRTINTLHHEYVGGGCP